MRAVLLGIVLASSAWVVHGGAPPAPVHAAGLSALPMSLGTWSGRDEPPFDADTLRVLGVDTYVNRAYVSTEAAEAMVGVYVGFYGSQRQGDAIHSPLNCLPGSGWQPMHRSRVAVTGAGQEPFDATRLLVQKGRDRQVVLYWYEGRGRRVASEYWNKALLVADAVRSNRTDGALVRLMSPVGRSEAAADAQLLAFTSDLLPALTRALPGRVQERTP
jgi:EpsI family protein